jgi:hypothetical protein
MTCKLKCPICKIKGNISKSIESEYAVTDKNINEKVIRFLLCLSCNSETLVED